MGFKRNSGADIGGGDNWGIGPRHREKKKATREGRREAERLRGESKRIDEESNRHSNYRKQKRGIDD